ncbi:hypothetical protein MB02_01115 [Croceicoccus estronivorus]|uniref:phage tail protein n=1 Tax=Croceicoccus estronivorus TaxID=1172626 RepID=UPI000836137E|nr:phage tail protein [Croceicoccus estronivorus]OCC25304.1 hypothetical protein MB02_01115 [Croceicoccus estronivorus]
MNKPDSLRQFLTAALPELARDPDALTIYVTQGTLAHRHGKNLGFEIRYTLHLTLLDYRGEPEQVFLPVLLWLRANQAELILNHDTGVSAIAFDVDLLDNQAVDVEMRLPLTEAVDVLRQPDGSHAMTVRDEPPIGEVTFDPLTLLRQIWAPGGDAAEYLVGHPDP